QASPLPGTFLGHKNTPILLLSAFLLASVCSVASAVTTTLTSDFTADSLTINAGDIFQTNGYEVTITSDIVINGELDTRDIYASNEGDGTVIPVGRDWTAAVTSTFTASNSTVTFNSANAATLTPGNTNFARVVINKANGAVVTLGNNLIITGKFYVS